VGHFSMSVRTLSSFVPRRSRIERDAGPWRLSRKPLKLNLLLDFAVLLLDRGRLLLFERWRSVTELMDEKPR